MTMLYTPQQIAVMEALGAAKRAAFEQVGRAVNLVAAPKPEPALPKARPHRRILRSFTGVRPGFEHLGRRTWELHATKGWRHYRAGA